MRIQVKAALFGLDVLRAAHGMATPENKRPKVRIGMHIGTVGPARTATRTTHS